MTSAMERGWLMLILMVAVSNLGCQETRFLSCTPRNPRAEIDAYENIHDPFPDDSMGPQTGSRPRDFQLPRTDEYKSFEYRNRRAAGAAGPPLATRPGLWDDTSRQYNVVPH